MKDEKTGMSKRIALLVSEMDEAWQILCHRLEGLTEAEFFWEPVSGCWSVHATDDGRWVMDYAEPDPDPPPFTTIAWRLLHIAACKIMYYEYAFGPGRLSWDELQLPHTAAQSIEWLEDGQSQLRSTLESLCDDDLDELRRTNWGDLWPTWDIFWTMILHDLHHGGEIGCLRDLYRSTQS